MYYGLDYEDCDENRFFYNDEYDSRPSAVILSSGRGVNTRWPHELCPLGQFAQAPKANWF